MSSAGVPNFKMDNEDVRFLALCIQAFTQYFGDNVLKVANREGNRCLALYENGLLAFKPIKTSVCGGLAKVKKLITKPSWKSPQRSPASKKRKSSIIPKRLRASKKKSSKYPSTGTETKKDSKKTGPQKKLTSVKQRTKPSRKIPQRSPVSKKKGSPKRPPASTKRKSKSPSTGTRGTKKPSKEIAEICKRKFTALVAFSSIDVYLAHETISDVDGILEDGCQELIDNIVSHTSDTKELNIECIEAALFCFPKN
ncbi:hypothetical protein AVEN_35483-1 [Araneus ventricosus]|uniref:Uncharacterized protein n=1 Tax=Araneus ventricosus TaxID=182803 RepID=A0A4Y2TNC1_ARAVE|nr:hypothetical protein AVEN_35483-1 [Araneus ventricosus]